MDGNLVKASLAVKANEVQSAMGVAKVVKGIITMGNGVFKGKGDGIEQLVVDTEAPDEVSNVLNVLLVGFGGKDNLGAPGASTRVNPSLVKQVVNVGLHNWFFMYAIVGLVACDRLGCTGINAKLETADRAVNTGSIKAVPIVLDDGGEFGMYCQG